MKYVFVKNFAKLRKKNWWFLELVYRLLYDQNAPSFSPSVIKYWKIAVRYDLYLASARFLRFEKCAIDRLCRGKVARVIRHATVLCASFIGNKNQVATWTLMALQFESNTVYWAWLSNQTDSWSVFGINLYSNLKVLSSLESVGIAFTFVHTELENRMRLSWKVKFWLREAQWWLKEMVTNARYFVITLSLGASKGRTYLRVPSLGPSSSS